MRNVVPSLVVLVVLVKEAYPRLHEMGRKASRWGLEFGTTAPTPADACVRQMRVRRANDTSQNQMWLS